MIALRPERTSAPAGPATDLRFALETMAQMMRTNSDALRLVAESQVDLAKTIASVKGLPRNAAMYLPPTAPALAVNDEADDDDDDIIDEQSQQAAPTNAFDLLMPFSEALAEKIADVVPNLAPGLFGGASANGTPADTASAPTAADDNIANRPFEPRELIDIGYAHRKGEAKRAASQQRPEKRVSLQARVMKDPQLFRQVTAIQKLLTPDEINTLMSSASTWSEAAATKFLDTIKPLPVNDAVVYCREVIKSVLAHQANAQTEKGGDATDPH